MKQLKFILVLIFLFQFLLSHAIYYKIADFNSWGRVVSLDKKDNFIYTVKWSGLLEIIDVSTPTHPEPIGSINILDNIPGVMGRIVVSDTLAFVLGQNSIHVIDVSEPTNPEYLTALGFGMSWDIIILENLAYIAGYFKMQVMDISDILNPQLLGSLNGQLDGICLKNNHIYGAISGYPAKLRIIDVMDPLDPTLVTDFELSGMNSSTGSDIAISGYNVFLVNGKMLWSIDIDDPITPIISDSVTTKDHIYKIFIDNSKALITNSYSGIKVIDITDPGELVNLEFYDTPGLSEQVVASEDIAYIANGYSGLQIIDISDNYNPFYISSFQTFHKAKGFDIQNNHLFLADGNAGLDVLDISNVTNPIYLDTYFGGYGVANSVSIHNNRLCFGKDYPFAQLLLIDISVPENPVLLNTFDYSYLLFESIVVCQTNTNLFVGAFDTLSIYDITDFSNPLLLSKYKAQSPITDVQISAEFGFISLGANGVEIVNVENTVSPQFIASFDTPGYANNILIHADVLIISDREGGLHIYDVSDPTMPSLIETFMPNYNSNIVLRPLIVDNKMIVVDREWNEIVTYDISDVYNINFQSSQKVNFEINDMIYKSGLLFCSLELHGLIVIDGSPIVSVKEKEKEFYGLSDFSIFPNPFKSNTTVSYKFEADSFVSINIFNASGKKVKSLINQIENIGTHYINWDGTDEFNNKMPAGLYFIRLNSNGKRKTSKILMVD